MLIGGGANATRVGGGGIVALASSYPSTTGANGVWTGVGVVTTALSSSGQLKVDVYAICG
jgi:hypothetical protein